ncbi:subtilisin-like protein [Anaeromyces robustus]|uniref:Subtilisin-like protein n=1 Tax=Anaeromyces robustus TaxID=1754192 RepID=A0A1Y1XGF1_9FUNG|nr:subtilisin-like protein [Anaeromyces robustus]|eukprot:ORX84831.1 subtilisin-like protein [Anaeromyces robustus]
MKSFIYLFFLLGLFNVILKSYAYPKKTESSVNENKNKNEDKFYMIFINTTIIPEKSKITRRNLNSHQGKEELTKFMINEIHELILDNIETFKNPEKVEELEELDTKLKKRDNKNTTDNNDDDDNGDILVDNNDYSLTRFISEVKDEIVLYAYLSPIILKKVEAMPNVKGCELSGAFKPYASNDHYNLNEIIKETGWRNVEIKKNAPSNLSLLSQGSFSENLIKEYDDYYYYPYTAGKDIDIIIIDANFDFRHDEFSNTQERTVECPVYADNNGSLYYSPNKKFCNMGKKGTHGTSVSDSAAGNLYGVARRANIYGLTAVNYEWANILAVMKYAKSSIIRKNKSIINMSFGDFVDKNSSYFENHFHQLLKELNNENVVLISSAGNENSLVETKSNTFVVPCVYSEVICVGAIGNPDSYYVKMTSKIYQKASWSNYGDKVDIYAPGNAYVNYKYGEEAEFRNSVSGTSFSSPIVAGVAACIMSENQGQKFNSNIMKDYLLKLAQKDVIEDSKIPTPNYFVNNGKKVVYSKNGYYSYSCGINAANRSCSSNQCCSLYGYCETNKIYCTSTNGCQRKYGSCQIEQSSSRRCGLGYGSCPSGQCCSYDGYCGTSTDYCSLGCQDNYGKCS